MSDFLSRSATLSFVLFAAGAMPLLAGAEEKLADKLPAPAKTEIDFVKHIEPMLRTSCITCHGSEAEEGGLRLDVKERIFAGGDTGKVITPGDSAKSRLVHLIAGADEDLGIIMPPDGEGTPLTAEQIGLFRAWIDQGAKWPDEAFADAKQKGADHWSFQPIKRPEVPTPKHMAWIRNPIDAFVLARLEAEGIEPSPAANKAMLMRRVYLDLLGLPPSPEEVADFLADEGDDAYERLVDRLLRSPHYGERWGRHWLDLARYADSDGYEKDKPRPNAWRYRDWVIFALNEDMPFDDFTIKQIAGDLLPPPQPPLAKGGDSVAPPLGKGGYGGVDDRVATGFHRNTLHNTEGGADPEEDRVKKTVDRTNTVGTIWLGLTVGCAQCHSHKYDPLTQREYYSLYGFFNSIDETDVNALARSEQAKFEKAIAQRQGQIDKLKAAIAEYEMNKLPPAQAAWEASFDPMQSAWQPLAASQATSKHGAMLKQLEDKSILVSGTNNDSDAYTIEATSGVESIAAIRLEVLPDDSLPHKGPGRATNGNFVLHDIKITAAPASGEGKPVELNFSEATADFSQNEWPVAALLDKSQGKGWAVSPRFGQRHVATFLVAKPAEFSGGTKLKITLDQNYQGAAHNLGRFRLSVSGSAAPVKLDEKTLESVAAILGVAPQQRTAEQKKTLTGVYRTIDPELRRLQAELHGIAQAAKPPAGAKAQAVSERSSPRQTRVHIRGNFLDQGEPVSVNTPEVLPDIHPRGKQPDRLDLARWMVDPANPLTARVTVNRMWQRYFGRGISPTVDDFGLQGEEPSHPQLLDWLASELIDNGWRLKHVHRLIVTSATYRQSCATRQDLIDVDPENILLARQLRRRVEAEIVRDLALAASGLLDRTVGGPSVRPPQPAEYSKLTYANSASWKTSPGGDRYRRGLYTFFQRTSPYPMLMTFDSPDSNECIARRAESNTPLQALTIWNDPVFVECAQTLGRRIVSEAKISSPSGRGQGEGQETDEEKIRNRIRYAFVICLARQPDEDETAALVELYNEQLALAKADAKAIDALIGKKPIPQGVTKPELAAWIMVGRTLLNLDEFITKE